MTLTIISIINVVKRQYTWDMLPYIAAVLNIENSDFDEIHTKVYTTARSDFSNENYNRLTEENEYRKTMEINAEAFAEQIPFYSIKFSYIYLTYLFYKIVVSLTFAAIIPYILSVSLIRIIMLIAFKRIMRIEFAALASISIIIITIIYNSEISGFIGINLSKAKIPLNTTEK